MWPQGLYNLPVPGMQQNEYHRGFYRKAGWERKFCWWPRQCQISQKWIWLEQAYQGTSIWTGSGGPIVERRWHTSQEHLLWKLKQGAIYEVY
jgi:hypothetical protein